MESRNNMTYNKKEYQKLIKDLYKNKDEQYKQFHSKLLKDNSIELIGIRTPELKKIAKEISKNDYKSFIKENTHQTYEECTLHGLVLGYIKTNEKELLKLIDDFIPYINNWATNDLTVSNLKTFKKINIENINKYIKSDNPWEIRFGLTLLLSYYINEENLDKIFNICDSITSTHYYVEMANAWLISICFIKYPNQTFNYLKICKLNKFTKNKAISKICDSFRVTKEYKEKIKELRI